jgi:hypothetical protein
LSACCASNEDGSHRDRQSWRNVAERIDHDPRALLNTVTHSVRAREVKYNLLVFVVITRGFMLCSIGHIPDYQHLGNIRSSQGGLRNSANKCTPYGGGQFPQRQVSVRRAGRHIVTTQYPDVAG